MTYNGEYRPQADLCAGWHLDNLYDFSGNGKTMTNVGTSTFSELTLPDGKIGKCLALGSPNSTKYLNCASISQTDIDIDLSASGITLAGWIRISALPAASAYPTFIYWDSHQTTDRYVFLSYKNDGGTYKLQANFSGTVTTYSVTLTVGVWYWVVFTAAAGAGAATTLYLNGAQVATGTKGTSASDGFTFFYIGKHHTQPQYWPGYLYQIAAYKKVFTATEILDWYNYQVGTEETDIYIQLNDTKLNAYVSTEVGMAADGGDIEMDVSPSASLDYASLVYAGRNERVYSFRILNNIRSTVDTFLNIINNAEEMDTFCPHSRDRTVYIKKAQAIIGSPIMYWPVAAGRWYYSLNCKIYAMDQFQYGYKKNIFIGENVVMPTETVTVTNNGTYKSGLDYLKVSGYYDSGGPTYSIDLTLTMNEKAMLLCDRLLQGDEFTVNRYGRISHKIYTDFDDTLANFQNYFDAVEGAPGAATAGYHLGGDTPITNLSVLNNPTHRFIIKVDAEASFSSVSINVDNCTSLGTTATEMQTNIRALGGAYAAVSVVVTENRLKIISGTTGLTSKVRIGSDSYDEDVCWALQIGTGTLPLHTDYVLEGENHDGVAASTPYIYLGESSIGWAESGSIASMILSGQGYHVSGVGAATNLSSGYGTYGKLKIQVDAVASPTEITLTLASCTTGGTTATEMQTRIRAISADYAKVEVRYLYETYTIISQRFTSESTVVITPGDTVDITSALKLGTANGGTTYAGSASLRSKFNIQADAAASPTEVTLTLSQPYTNDPAAGSNIDLSIANTDIFELMDKVVVMSSAGSEIATVTGVNTNVSIRVASLALNHTTTSRFVAGYVTNSQCAREIQNAIQALGGVYADVTCTYSMGKYYIYSGVGGATSKIRITDATTNNVAERMLFGAASRGEIYHDGGAGSIAKNAFSLTSHGSFLIPLYGPLVSSSPPYIEFLATLVVGNPKAVYISDGLYVYMPDEIVLGYNKIWFPDLQAVADIRIGIYCDEDSRITLFDLTAEVKRDVSMSYFPTVAPGETLEFSLSCGGSSKLSEVELFYRDAFWS